MTDIFCVNEKCKYCKEKMIDKTTVAHENCSADAINLYQNDPKNRNSFYCTMFESK